MKLQDFHFSQHSFVTEPLHQLFIFAIFDYGVKRCDSKLNKHAESLVLPRPHLIVWCVVQEEKDGWVITVYLLHKLYTPAFILSWPESSCHKTHLYMR